MRLFTLINGWALRNDYADALVRLFTLFTIPVLATLLAALLILVPRAPGVRSRPRIACAALLALLGCIGVTAAINLFAASVLGSNILSPRPFVTHAVNTLLVEPNDNSFPSIEVMIAAALVVMLWAARPRLLGWLLPIAPALAIGRIYCGINYPVDVIAALAMGWAVAATALAICGISLQVVWGSYARSWATHYQAVTSCLTLVVATVFCVPMANAALYQSKMRILLSGKSPDAENAADKLEKERPASHDPAVKEGEGATAVATFKEIPAPGVTEFGGYLPTTEKQLFQHLKAAGITHRLVSLDVAEVKLPGGAYRSAEVRFEVKTRGAAERRATISEAARIVRIAYFWDPKLRNIDVVGVVLNPGPDDIVSDGSAPGLPNPIVFSTGIVPVFSASVTRDRLVATGAAAWTNAPGVDLGLWLRARSRLYINAHVLPLHDHLFPFAPPRAPMPRATTKSAATPISAPIIAPTAVAATVPTQRPAPAHLPLSPTPGSAGRVFKTKPPTTPPQQALAGHIAPPTATANHAAALNKRPVLGPTATPVAPPGKLAMPTPAKGTPVTAATPVAPGGRPASSLPTIPPKATPPAPQLVPTPHPTAVAAAAKPHRRRRRHRHRRSR